MRQQQMEPGPGLARIEAHADEMTRIGRTAGGPGEKRPIRLGESGGRADGNGHLSPGDHVMTMRPVLWGGMLAAAGTGALLMYMMDPKQGRRRAALLRDRWTRLASDGRGALEVALRDLRHRAHGVVATTSGMFRRRPPDDAVLEGRVRACLGRWVSRPHAITVSADHGRVTLSGALHQPEQQQALKVVRGVRGVKKVDNQLKTLQTTESAAPPTTAGRPRHEFMQQHWAPGPRLLAAGAGAGMAVWGFGQRNIGGAGLGLLGLALATRAASNKSFGHLLGVPGAPESASRAEPTRR